MAHTAPSGSAVYRAGDTAHCLYGLVRGQCLVQMSMNHHKRRAATAGGDSGGESGDRAWTVSTVSAGELFGIEALVDATLSATDSQPIGDQRVDARRVYSVVSKTVRPNT
jgi:hypothetical protein